MYSWQGGHGDGSGSGPGFAAASGPPPVRWDLDVAAALGIGSGGILARGVSPSAATSGAWASTSFARSGSLTENPLPSRGAAAATLAAQARSRSLSAASPWGPLTESDAAPLAQQQEQQLAGVQRLKIRLRVPPGTSSAGAAPSADGGSGGGGRRQSSGSGARSARTTPYDESWFAEHVGREPRRAFSIHDEVQVCDMRRKQTPRGSS